MDMTCEVIRDLAELYKEKLVSKESMQTIREHLRTCEACRRYYKEYDSVRQAAPVPTRVREDSDLMGMERRTWQHLSERMRRRRTLSIIGTGAVIGAGSIMMAIGLVMVTKSMHRPG